MSAPKIRVWVEIFTREHMTEQEFDVPEGWHEMTDAEREESMTLLFEKMRNELANGGYEVIYP